VKRSSALSNKYGSFCSSKYGSHAKEDFEGEVERFLKDFKKFKILPRVLKIWKIYSEVSKKSRRKNFATFGGEPDPKNRHLRK